MSPYIMDSYALFLCDFAQVGREDHSFTQGWTPREPPGNQGAPQADLDGLRGSPGKSQKEGQKNQGEVKQLGGPPWLFHLSLVLVACLLALSWAPWHSPKLA